MSAELARLFQQALQLHQAGRLPEAEPLYRQILQQQPQQPDTLHLLASLLFQKGEPQAAVELNGQALALRPDNPSYHFNQGLILTALKDASGAIRHYRRAVALKPDFAEAWNNLASALKDQGEWDAALEASGQALALKPDYAEAHYNLANTLYALQRLGEAQQHYRQALRLRPDLPMVWNNLGNVLRDQGHYEEAVAHYRKAVDLNPAYAEAWNNLGNGLKDQGCFEEAVNHYRTAVSLNPDYAEAWNNLGAILRELCQPEAALECYRKSLALNPDSAKTRSNLLFLLGYHVWCPPETILREHQDWDRYHGVEGRAHAFRHLEAGGDPERRLRVGYVSPDLRHHSVSFFFEPLLAAHDRDRVEVFCYAEVAHPDAITTRLQGLADRWRGTVGLSDAELARLIHEDRIDILVDLAGHTTHNRLQAFTYKPAPVQATYLGYFTTTGLAAMDYWITDETLHPVNTTELAAEALYRLPRCCLSYRASADAPAVRDRAVSGLPLTFGSFNDLSKISPATLALWSRVLQAAPESRLMLKARQLSVPSVRRDLAARLAELGIEEHRLALTPATPSYREHLALYGEIDIALDTVPRTGGTTTAEALWMGVPVITLAGRRFIERLSATMLDALDLDELIAESEQDFIAKAVGLAQDSEHRNSLRASLRARMAASPLCDGPGLARALEAAYRAMWRRHLNQTRTAAPAPKKTSGSPIAELLDAAHRHASAGRRAEAERALCELLQQEPAHTEAAFLLGSLLYRRRDYAQALSCYQTALDRDPNNALIHYDIGLTCEGLGQIEAALRHYQKAAQCKPELADAWNNAGTLYQQMDRLDRAEEQFRQALRISPNDALYRNNLAIVLKKLGRPDEAIAEFHHAAQLAPDFPEAHYNLGLALQTEGRAQEAIACFERAVQLRPDYAEAWNNLGNAHREAGNHEEALAHYRRAIALRPDNADAHSNLLFTLAYNVLRAPEEMLREHREWDRLQGVEGRACGFAHSRRDEPERLRIGYVSPDLRNHPVSAFFEPLLAAHDRRRIEIFCYAEVARPDAVTARLRGLSDHWRFTVGLSDAELARRIHDDRIDVLIDLAGHTAGNRLRAFTFRPAPVQATYLGYFTTTGLSAMDYWISDAVLTPEETVEQATEKLYRLPRCCLCYTGPADTPAVHDRSGGEAPLTFGSFNDLSKISPATVALWAGVLQRLPQARLLLKTRHLADPALRERLARQFAAHGIRPERLSLRGLTPSHKDHLALYGEMDIALDTVPRTGGSTTAEALWMGVPVISLAGARFIERLSASMLSALDLRELIATTEEDFIGEAVALAQDPARRKALRASLRARFAAAALGDARGLAGALEQAYRDMWRARVKSES